MDDSGIIELYFARAEAAIEKTAEKYGAYLNTLAYNILRSAPDAEEVVQDTYLRTWNAIPPERPRMFRHFLSRIARNLAFNRLEYMSAKRRSAEVTSLLAEYEDMLPDARGSAEACWEARHLGALLNAFLSTLTREERRVFLWRYYYAAPIKDIAASASLPERRVKYILSCLRRRLRDYLEEEGISI